MFVKCITADPSTVLLYPRLSAQIRVIRVQKNR